MRLRTLACRNGMTKKAIITMLVLSTVLGMSGCGTEEIRKLGASVAAQGQLTCDKALLTYEKIEDWQARMEAADIKLRLLTHPAPDQVKLTGINSSVNPLQREISVRKKAYKAIKDTYEAFNRLSDPAFAKNTEDAAKSLVASINSIEQIPDISSSAKGIISSALGEIVRQVQAGKIKEHNKQLSKLSEGLEALWNDDKKVWQDHLDATCRIAESGIDGLKEDRFDLARLKDFVKEPYSQSRNLLLFKQQEIEKHRSRRDEIKADLDKVGKAFELLESTHSELKKERPVLDNVVGFLAAIKYVLSEVK